VTSIEKRRARVNSWAARNREYLRVKAHTYRQSNRGKCSIKNIQYKRTHKKEGAAQYRAWMVRNKAHRDAYMKEWWAKNRHLKKAYDTKRRVKRRLRDEQSYVGDSRVNAVIASWKKQALFHCYYCQFEYSRVELHVEHVIPVCKGGTHSVSNVAKSCAHCNQSKRDKMPSSFEVLGQRFLDL
jgi:5-methylcytosine-specific restriction endonuclease McrA